MQLEENKKQEEQPLVVPIVAQETEDELWDDVKEIFYEHISNPFVSYEPLKEDLKSKFTIQRRKENDLLSKEISEKDGLIEGLNDACCQLQEKMEYHKDRQELAEKHLKEFISMHETGLLPNRFTYEDAKLFFDKTYNQL